MQRQKDKANSWYGEDLRHSPFHHISVCYTHPLNISKGKREGEEVGEERRGEEREGEEREGEEREGEEREGEEREGEEREGEEREGEEREGEEREGEEREGEEREGEEREGEEREGEEREGEERCAYIIIIRSRAGVGTSVIKMTITTFNRDFPFKLLQTKECICPNQQHKPCQLGIFTAR